MIGPGAMTLAEWPERPFVIPRTFKSWDANPLGPAKKDPYPERRAPGPAGSPRLLLPAAPPPSEMGAGRRGEKDTAGPTHKPRPCGRKAFSFLRFPGSFESGTDFRHQRKSKSFKGPSSLEAGPGAWETAVLLPWWDVTLPSSPHTNSRSGRMDASHRFIHPGWIGQGLLLHSAVDFGNLAWAGFPTWLRTMRTKAAPSEWVAAETLKSLLPPSLPGKGENPALKKFLAGKIDLEKPPGIR